MIGALFCVGMMATTVHAQQALSLDAASRQLSHDIFKQLIEINTTDSVGSTTVAAEAMRKRLLDAGFAAGAMGFNVRRNLPPLPGPRSGVSANA